MKASNDYAQETMSTQPTIDEFPQWKKEQESLGRDVRLHEEIEDGGTIWLSRENQEWVEMYWDRNETRIRPAYMEVE